MVDVGGVFLAVLSAIFNGTFGTLSKIKRVQDAETPPPIFNMWMCCGILISSLPALAAGQVFTPWGFLAGAFFVVSMASTLFAIKLLGLSTASGVWCGTAVVVSFTFGVKGAGDVIHSAALAAPGLVILVAGIFGIALNGQVASRRHETQDMRMLKAEELIPGAEEEKEVEDELEDGVENNAALLNSKSHETKGRRVTTSLAGLLLALLAGIFGGLVLAPMTYAREEATGIVFVPSMALGVLITAPFVTAGLILAGHAPWRLYTRAAAIPGILAGCLWNAGNMCSILATQNPNVGLAIAYPIMQSGLCIAGLWGIILFHELRGREQIGYWISSIVLIAGATLLTLSK